MNDHEKTWYLQEILMHAHAASQDYAATLLLLGDDEQRQTRNVWFVITSFLSNAAMISKYVNPIGNTDVKRRRRETLQKILELDENSQILSRDARDNIEHFDERIDNWVDKDPNTIIELVCDDREQFEYLHHRDTRIRRVLLQDSLIFITENRQGEMYELELTPIF